MALKYQIFIEGTSLFAEVELSEKITSEMKQEILGETDKNLILRKKQESFRFEGNYTFGGSIFDNAPIKCSNFDPMEACNELEQLKEFCCENNANEIEEFFKDESIKYNKSENNNNNKPGDEFMEMINTQDFIEGFWEENDYTKKIIEKYEKEYKLIKELNDKNIDEKTAITILIIYSINKDYNDLLNDLIMVIKKAKIFIQKVTNDSYENIIKEVNFS